MSRDFSRSEALLRRARRVTPLGAQTFSKSATHLPHGAAPFFLERGRGARVWDVDGNEYLDFVNALAAVTLGHGDPDVDAAVRAQLERGVSFSLAHPIECQVAEAVVELVPCAERVRFLKNGSDATAAAVRLARAATGRDHVAVCGYHGWHDWTIGATSRHRGVPAATRELTHPFRYDDAGSLEALLAGRRGGFAAVVMEPMSSAYPGEGFLEAVRDLAHAHGALLVFDETITGFRFARGGAQELFGVVPDLATFGKGIANGFPLAVLAGPADPMDLLEEVFVSTTFGGETLSLAAAGAVLAKLVREPVLETLAARGGEILAGLEARIAGHGLGAALRVSGHPSWSFLHCADPGGASAWEIKTFLLQELFERGILLLGTHNLSYAHGPDEVARLLQAYDEVLPRLAEALATGSVKARLRCEPLRPLFAVRGG